MSIGIFPMFLFRIGQLYIDISLLYAIIYQLGQILAHGSRECVTPRFC